MVKKTRVIKDFLLFRLLTFDFFILITIFKNINKEETWRRKSEKANKQTKSQILFGDFVSVRMQHTEENKNIFISSSFYSIKKNNNNNNNEIVSFFKF